MHLAAAGWAVGLIWLSASAQAQLATPANLAGYGSVRVVDARTGGLLADAANLVDGSGTPVAVGPGNALEVVWAEARDVREIRLQSRDFPNGLVFRVDGWTVPAGLGGPTPGTNSPWAAQAGWRPLGLGSEVANGSATIQVRPFEPGASGAGSGPAPAVVRTHGVRILASALVLIERITVTGDAVLRRARLRFEWSPDPPVAGQWSPRFEARNGRVVSATPDGRNAAVLEVEYAQTQDPTSADRGQLIFRSGETRSCAVLVEDALRPGGVLVRGLDLKVREDGAGPAPDAPRVEPAQGPVPPVSVGAPVQAGRERSALVLGVPGLRQKFHVHPGGEIELRRDSLRTPGPDRVLRPWKWPNLVYQFGLGEHPVMGPRTNPAVARSLEEGWLPVVRQAWTHDGLEAVQTVVATTLMGDPADLATTNGCDPAVLVARVELRNRAAEARTARLWLEFSRSYPLRVSVDGTVFLLAASDGHAHTNHLPVRARFNTMGKGQLDLAVLLPGGPGSHNPDLAGTAVAREALRYTVELDPGAAHAIEVAVPAVELLAPEQAAALKGLTFAKVRGETVRFWREQWGAGLALEVPDPRVNAFLKASLWRTLTAIDLEPANGHSHFVGTGADRIRLADLAAVVQSLEIRGEQRAARLLVEPLLVHPDVQAGVGGGMDRPGSQDPYFGRTSGLHQARALTVVAEHFQWSHDEGWLRRMAEGLVRACDWTARWRRTNRYPVAGGGAPEGATILPGASAEARDPDAGTIEAMASSLHALDRVVAGLEVIRHPDAVRLEREAVAFRKELRAAVAEAVAVSSVTMLGAGDYVPRVPHRWHALTQRREGWWREGFHAPLELFSSGLFAPDHPYGGWLEAELREGLAWADTNSAAGKGMALERMPRPPELGWLLLQRGQGLMAAAEVQASLALLGESDLPLIGSRMARSEDSGLDPVVLECMLFRQIRDLVILEKEGELELGAGIPPVWMADGQRTRLQRAGTRYGTADLEVFSQAEANRATARFRFEPLNTLPKLILHLRHPSGRPMRAVTVNGRPGRLDPEGRTVELPREGRSWEIVAEF